MTTAFYLYQKHQSNLSYQKDSFEIKKRFDKYILTNYRFIDDIDHSLKSNFKHTEEEEEINAFFELSTNELISEMDFYVVSYDDFQMVDNLDRNRNFLEKMQEILYSSLKNSDIMLKALNTMDAIANFYTSLVEKKNDLISHISLMEKDLAIYDTLDKLQATIESAVEICLRMMKAVRKIKKTQITFTIDEELLSSLIQEIDKKNIALHDILQHSTETKNSFEKLQQEIETVLQSDLSIQNDDIDFKVKSIATEFSKFFINSRNSTNKFLAGCYVYRDKIIEDCTDYCSAFANLLLGKLTSYRSFIFLKYYDETIEPTTDRDIKQAFLKVKKILDNDSLTQDYKTISDKVFSSNLAILYTKDILFARKIDDKIFYNIYYKEKLPKIAAKVDAQSLKLKNIEKELKIIDKILPFYYNYIEATHNLKLINLKDSNIDKKLEIQKIIQKFVLENNKLEAIIINYKDTSAETYQQINDLIEGNKIISEEYKSLFFLMDK